MDEECANGGREGPRMDSEKPNSERGKVSRDEVARATWFLVWITGFLLLANAVLAGSTVWSNQQMRAAFDEQQRANAARVYVLLTTATDNGPTSTADLFSSAPIYDLRTWCLAYVRNGATTINTQVEVAYDPAHEATLLAPGIITTIPFSACVPSTDKIDSIHPVIRAYIYFLYRDYDGTPHESQWGTEWNSDMHEFGNANPKLFLQHADVLGLARRDLDAHDYLRQTRLDGSL